MKPDLGPKRPDTVISAPGWKSTGVRISSSHTDSQTVTFHPVPKGQPIADYSIKDPTSLELTISVSSWQLASAIAGPIAVAVPFKKPKYPIQVSASAGVGAAARAVTGALGIGGPLPDNLLLYPVRIGDPFTEEYEALRKHFEDVTLLTVTTPIRKYRDMVLTSIRVVQTGNDDDEHIAMTFAKVTTVSTALIDVSVPAIPAMANSTDAGTQTANAGNTNGQASPPTTILGGLYRSARNLL